jgi:hypothetical protein
MRYKEILIVGFVLLLFGMGLNFGVYILNTISCEEFAENGYKISSYPTFMEPTCEIRTDKCGSIGIHLLEDCPCGKEVLENIRKRDKE